MDFEAVFCDDGVDGCVLRLRGMSSHRREWSVVMS